MVEEWEETRESRQKGGFVPEGKTCPEVAVLVMSQIHLPWVRKTSLQKDSPQKDPKTKIRTPQTRANTSSAAELAGMQDFCHRENPSTPKLTFSIRPGIKKKKYPSFTAPF